MLASMSARTFAEWQAYGRVEPWGEEMAELRHGVQCALIFNTSPNRTKRSKLAKPEDFMPVYKANMGREQRRPRKGKDPDLVKAERRMLLGGKRG